jgi:uncharacterized membrane protein
MRRISLVGPRRPYDLVLISAIVVLTVILSQLKVESPVRWILAFFSIYFAPGYALVSLLFPGKRVLLIGTLLMKQEARSPHVSLLERVVLSFLFSITVVAISGTILSRGISDVTAMSVGLEVLVITVGASAIALYFRSRLSPDDYFKLTLTIGAERARFTTGEKVTAAIIAGSLFIAAVVVVNGLSGHGTKETYTEFYITGPDGTLSTLPASVLEMENVTVVLKVTNRMNQGQAYDLTIGLKNGSSFDRQLPLTWADAHVMENGDGYYTVIELENNEAFEREFTFQIASSGAYELSFILNDGDKEKQLWLQLEVNPAT